MVMNDLSENCLCRINTEMFHLDILFQFGINIIKCPIMSCQDDGTQVRSGDM